MNRPPYSFCNKIVKSVRVSQDIQRKLFRQRTILATRSDLKTEIILPLVVIIGDKKIFCKESGFFYFFNCKLIFQEIKKILYHFTHEKFIFSMI